MNINDTKKLLAKEALVLSEQDGYTLLDGDSVLGVIDRIYADFKEALLKESLGYKINFTEPPKIEPFLADVGLPYYTVVSWSEPEQMFVYAEIEIDIYLGVENDIYFSSAYCNPKSIKNWIELPKLK